MSRNSQTTTRPFPTPSDFLREMRRNGKNGRRRHERLNPDAGFVTRAVNTILHEMPDLRMWWLLPILGTLTIALARRLYDILGADGYFQGYYLPGFSDTEEQDNLETVERFAWIAWIVFWLLSIPLSYRIGNRLDDSSDLCAFRRIISVLQRKRYLLPLNAIEEDPTNFIKNLNSLKDFLLHLIDHLILEGDYGHTAKRQDYWNATIDIVLAVEQFIVENEIPKKLETALEHTVVFNNTVDNFDAAQFPLDLLCYVKEKMISLDREIPHDPNSYRIELPDRIPPDSLMGPDRATALEKLFTDEFMSDFRNDFDLRSALRRLITEFFSHQQNDSEMLEENVETLRALSPEHQAAAFILFLTGNETQRDLAMTLFWHEKFTDPHRARILSALIQPEVYNLLLQQQILFQLFDDHEDRVAAFFNFYPELATSILVLMEITPNANELYEPARENLSQQEVAAFTEPPLIIAMIQRLLWNGAVLPTTRLNIVKRLLENHSNTLRTLFNLDDESNRTRIVGILTAHDNEAMALDLLELLTPSANDIATPLLTQMDEVDVQQSTKLRHELNQRLQEQVSCCTRLNATLTGLFSSRTTDGDETPLLDPIHRSYGTHL